MIENRKLFYTAFIIAVVLIASLCVNIAQFAYHQARVHELKWQLQHRDTVTVVRVKRDTVHHVRPVEKEVQLVEKLTVQTVRDTVRTHSTDTLYRHTDGSIDIPITQARYTDDSTYTAWVSGYKPRLDSVEVYRKTQYTTTTVTQPPDAPKRRTFWDRFRVGIIGGYTYGFKSKRWEPSAGVGGSFEL